MESDLVTHLVMLGPRGRLGRGETASSTASSVRRVFEGLTQAKARSLSVFFHAGLQDLGAEVALSSELLPQIADNWETYPIFFAWGGSALLTIRGSLVAAVQDIRFLPALRSLLEQIWTRVEYVLDAEHPTR